MKELKILVIVVLLGGLCGFLLALALLKKPTYAPIDQKLIDEILASQKEIKRSIDGFELPRVIKIPGTDSMIIIDSTTPIGSCPMEEFMTEDSFQVWYGSNSAFASFGLTFGFQGLAHYYKIKPINNIIQLPEPEVNPFSLLGYGGVNFNQSLKFENLEVGIFGFYKRIGAHGRIELYPTADSIPTKFLFGGAFRFL